MRFSLRLNNDLPIHQYVTLAGAAEEAGFDEPRIVFTWHKLTGEPIDLRELAERRPQSTSDFAMISGVGARKLEAYGEAFLSVIRKAAEG